MVRNTRGRKQGIWTRAVAGLLTLVLLCGLLPAVAHETASAADWAQEYLDQMVEWGVMRGDDVGDLYPTKDITRAEFAAMINRAYGYTEVGPTPFTDVESSAWYADDIAIAYRAGYFNGTSATTASPNEPLTREQAVVILARNMILDENPGEVISFTDGRDFNTWSQGVIRSAVQAGLIKGYDDGTFRPQSNIVREEVATILYRAIGTLIQDPGEQNLGDVYGNVVINTSGVNLRNTTIAGDLYLTGGIGMGDVLLENVNVLGRIVVSGAGESNKGDSSVLLRNVTSKEMVVDSPNNQFLTLRAEGDTEIQSTSVRTAAYLDDATAAGKGLLYIELDGEQGTIFQVAGNIEEVLNKTPDSHLLVAAGTAEKVTIDEKAVDSSMAIEMGATVNNLNLDVAASVSGNGDIDSLTVSAAGCTVSMLPDQITIRPGLTANINGVVMDSNTAAEVSLDPRLTAGYPTVKEIAPSTATAVFSTNKAGTIYWAITALTDGSTSEADLISPPVYGGTILQSGTINATASKTEYTAALTDLVSDGSYYLTTVMVDSKDRHSPVKVTAFTTPDDTIPAFATGYPVMSKVTCETSQATVMTNKSGQMYYALLPKNSVAPTTADLKAAAVTGNMGYGTVDVVKNTTIPIKVNSVYLEELETYDLYLWLNDYDNAHSSEVTKLTFTTQDETPPTVTYMEQTDAQAASITMTFALSEPGTLYYALVPEGDDFLVSTLAGQTVALEFDSEAAKIKVENGVGAFKKGSSAVKDGNSDLAFTISGLTASTAYDLYYVAKDAAGNYTDKVVMITVNTLDTTPPTAYLEFTEAETDANGNSTPEPGTDIRIVFSESVQGVDTVNGKREYNPFLSLYQDVQDNRDGAVERLADELRQHIKLYYVDGNKGTLVAERTAANDEDENGNDTDWVIDYRNVIVAREIIDSKSCMVVTFRNAINLNLTGGASYYFELSNIADTSMNVNLMTPSPQQLPFTTLFARLTLRDGTTGGIPHVNIGTEDLPKYADRVDMSFQILPSSTNSVDSSVYYDVFLWSDMIVYYDLYLRVLDDEKNVITDKSKISMFTPKGTGNTYKNVKDPDPDDADNNGWFYLGNDSIVTDGDSAGKSVNCLMNGRNTGLSFPQVNTLNDNWTYEFAITLTQVGTLTDYTTWSDEVMIGVTIPSGSESNVGNLATVIDETRWEQALGKNITAIGSPSDFYVSRQFNDTSVPTFTGGYPLFNEGDTFVNIDLQISRAGTVYYVIAPMTKQKEKQADNTYKYEYTPRIQTLYDDKTPVKPEDTITTVQDGKEIPYPLINGAYVNDEAVPKLSEPSDLEIYRPNYSNSEIKTGNVDLQSGTRSFTVEGLNTESIYYAFFVLRGTSQELSQVYCFQFTTTEAEEPTIFLRDNSPEVGVQTSTDAGLYWVLYPSTNVPSLLTLPFSSYVADNTDTSWEDSFKTGSGGALVSPSGATGTDGKTPQITVLDALLTDTKEPASNGNGGFYSVFDKYASESVKAQLFQYVTTQLEGNKSSGHGGEISPDKPDENNSYPQAGLPYTVDCTEYMTGTTRYYFIAAARNAQGSIYSFKAISNINLPDKTPPDYLTTGTSLTSAGTTPGGTDVTRDKWSSNNTDPGQYFYNGTVSVEFTEKVYVWNRDDNELVDLSTLGSTATEMLNHFGTIGLTITNVKISGSTIAITFTGATVGSRITLFTDGEVSDASRNSQGQGSRLWLTFNPYNRIVVENGKDVESLLFYTPIFEAEWYVP